jgi:hypothetical protein
MSASGRLLPPNFIDFGLNERPLSVRPDVQPGRFRLDSSRCEKRLDGCLLTTPKLPLAEIRLNYLLVTHCGRPSIDSKRLPWQ